MGEFNSTINGAATILPTELLPQLATASAVAPPLPPPPPSPQPGYPCARMWSGQVLNGMIDGNNVSSGASTCGTAVALLFPLSTPVSRPQKQKESLLLPLPGGDVGGGRWGGCWNPQRQVRTSSTLTVGSMDPAR